MAAVRYEDSKLGLLKTCYLLKIKNLIFLTIKRLELITNLLSLSDYIPVSLST